MIDERLGDYLGHMRTAATDAQRFLKGMSKDEFLSDTRTQRATIMCLVIIGEAAARIMDNYVEFVDANPAIPWRNMRGMRNRIAHGYFDVDLEVVWDTVQSAVPELSRRLEELRG
jgi:uncharacterized protein with HEPN domain